MWFPNNIAAPGGVQWNFANIIVAGPNAGIIYKRLPLGPNGNGYDHITVPLAGPWHAGAHVNLLNNEVHYTAIATGPLFMPGGVIPNPGGPPIPLPTTNLPGLPMAYFVFKYDFDLATGQPVMSVGHNSNQLRRVGCLAQVTGTPNGLVLSAGMAHASTIPWGSPTINAGGGVAPILAEWNLTLNNKQIANLVTGFVQALRFNIDPAWDYQLVSQVGPGGRVLDVTDGGMADGTNVQIWTNVGGNAQKWRIAGNIAAGFTLAPVHAPTKRLDVAGGAMAAGTNVKIWSITGGTAQLWTLDPVVAPGAGINTYKLTSRVGGNLVLDVHDGRNLDGTNVQIWHDVGGAAQRWRIVD